MEKIGLKIILVDDDRQFMSSLREHLKNCGYDDIREFNFISEALRFVSKAVDVIIINDTVNGLESIDHFPAFRYKLEHSKIIYLCQKQDIEVLAYAHREWVDFIFSKDDHVFEKIEKTLKAPRFDKKNTTRNNRLLNRPFRKRKKPLIYMLDDDQLFSTFVQFKLRNDPEFQLITFNDSATFLATVEKTKPQIALLDYNLDQTTSREIVNDFVDLSPFSKIVMLSGQSDPEIAIELFEAGIADYIVKNKNWEEALRSVIHKHLYFAAKQ
jgi:DNA-binding NarL/FixJ family response regulator